ncbi:MAG: glycerol-3-phosphate acyltransferase [Clostridia bacterium]|nr:glycerol-3-phosphate acyltransferase [Clostridia bacterium]
MTPFSLSEGWYWLLIGAVASYFLGCFNFAILISHLRHDDIRKVGSGNPGAMNMTRKYGLKLGLVNFFCDGLKGAIPAIVAHFCFKDFVFAGTAVNVADFTRYLFGLCAVIGHVFPVTLKFKGGKGVSTTIGLLWGALSTQTWWFVFCGLALFLLLFVYVGITEWGSMASLLGISGFTIWQAILFIVKYNANGMLSNVYVILIMMMLLSLNLITWIAHHKNIYRLMAGEEHHTSITQKLKKKKQK